VALRAQCFGWLALVEILSTLLLCKFLSILSFPQPESQSLLFSLDSADLKSRASVACSSCLAHRGGATAHHIQWRLAASVR